MGFLTVTEGDGMKSSNNVGTWVKTSSLLVVLFVPACGGDDEKGTLSVAVEAEDTIQDGIEAGDSSENIRDGWSVTFEKYVVTIGDIDLELSTDRSVTAEAPNTFAVDLIRIPSAGLPLWKLDGLEAGRWEFHYSTLGAADGATRHESVEGADFDAMLAGDFTYLIEGTATKSDGVSCPPATLATPPSGATSVGANAGADDCYENPSIAFALGVLAPTRFGPCELDGVPGVSIPAGGSQTVTATLHGDHLFFNGFPEGDESGITRLAQWLADCDLDLDGEVTRQELSQIRPSDLAEMDERFQFGGSPIVDIESQSLWIYVTAQLETQGHMGGEGECEIDGEAHVH
jgi:hypothetical protein